MGVVLSLALHPSLRMGCWHLAGVILRAIVVTPVSGFMGNTGTLQMISTALFTALPEMLTGGLCSCLGMEASGGDSVQAGWWQRPAETYSSTWWPDGWTDFSLLRIMCACYQSASFCQNLVFPDLFWSLGSCVESSSQERQGALQIA